MRKAIVAGQFYEADSKKLKNELKSLFDQTKKISVKGAVGLIVPHAGYFYSGKAAALAYQSLQNKFDTFVILGPNHSGLGDSISLEDFETPLGIAKNDAEFSKELLNFGILERNENAHKYEHSIEVQLPFLQYLFGKIKKSSRDFRMQEIQQNSPAQKIKNDFRVLRNENISDIKIVPIILGNIDYEKCKEIAEAIEKIAKKLKRKICVIASSDFTHYGESYGFIPFSGTEEEIKKKMYDLDKKAISFIEKLDGKEFFNFSQQITICGRIPITILTEYCKLLKKKAKAKLLVYYTSGDIVQDYSTAVGYASVIMYRD